MTNILALRPVSGAFNLTTDSDWRTSFAFTDATSAAIDITGIAFHLQARSAAGASVIALDLSTANGGLINGGASGILTLIAPVTMMESVAPGVYVADIVAEADGATINCCGASPLALTVAQGITTP